MNELTEEFQIQRNLKDAGFDEKTIQKYFQLCYEGKQKEQEQLLSVQRTILLNQIHDSQYKIDCLDYFIYNMKKGKIKK